MLIRKFAGIVIVFAVAMMPVCLPAQEAGQTGPASPKQTEPQHFYRLNLVVKELDEASRVVNARIYSMTVATETTKPGFYAPQIIKTGSRVPIATGTSAGGTEFQYVDLGVNFELNHVEERGNSLSFRLKAEISSIANEDNGVPSTLRADPVIRQNSWDSTVILPIGKPTVVSSADDLDSKGKIQVELTATPVE